MAKKTLLEAAIPVPENFDYSGKLALILDPTGPESQQVYKAPVADLKGQKGEKGDAGEKGEKGEKGDPGDSAAPAAPAVYANKPTTTPLWPAGTQTGQQAFYQDSAGELWSFLWNGTAWRSALATGQLLAKISQNGSVPPTQDGDQVRLDVNLIQDAPQGIQTYDGATNRFYEKSYVDAQITALYAALSGAASTPTLPSIFRYFFEAHTGVTLVGGAVDAWADKTGNGHNLIAQDATLRPVYDATGWAGKPCLKFNGAQGLWMPSLDLSDTQDVTLFVLAKRTGANVGALLEHSINKNHIHTGFNVILNEVVDVYAGVWGDVGNSVHGGAFTSGILKAQLYKSDAPSEARIFANGMELTINPYPSVGDYDNTNAFDNHPHFIGSRANSSLFAEMELAAIGLVPRKTTALEDAQIAAYLNHHYPANP